MTNLFQAWDEDIQALGAAKASDDQIEARRQQLAEHFKAKAKAAGLSSKKIYETLDQFDTYSRQKTTAQDNQLTPEEQEMAQRVKDGTLGAGAIKEVGKRFKDVGLGALSSLTRMGGDIAQTINDVSDNDKTTLSGQAAQGLYNVTDDIRSNYSEGTKRAKKDFWSPEGLTMGLAENVGQIAGTAALLGTGGALAGAAGVTSKAGKLLAMGTMAAPLAYSQGYGQGKENSLDEINKTSNAQLWENVKAEAKAYDDAGGTGEVPYLVSMFKEAGGDINLMKDLMAENAGNRAGIMTVATEPLAMGVGSLMSRGAAAGGTGVMAKFANAMNNQGMSNELARRVAAGGSAAIASQAGKIAATQMAREGVQETAQEGLEGYYAKGEGSRAAGRKGELTGEDWSSSDGNGIIQQGLQGGAIGLLMGAGGAGATLRNASKLALEKNGLPEKHDAALIAHEQAIANLEKATQILDLNPEDVKAQEVHAKAYDEALVATNNLEQLTGKFNALYTPEEQAVIKAKTMEGVAARKKVADDAAKAQKELDDANAKEQADIAAQQAEAIKTQRDAVVNNLAGMVGDDVALSNAVADLGLSEEEANSLLDDAHKVAKKQKKEAAKQPAPATATPKTPLEAAVDEAFNADGTRNQKAMSSDIAKKHNIPLKPLVDAISERIDSNSAKNKAAANEALAQKRQKEKQQADVLSEKQQLENTLADFAANNDHDSMVNFLRDYEPTEADKLIKNAYASVENKKKAEQDAIAATKKAEALKVKESEAKTQAEQKKIAFNNDMANLYAANPDRNPTKAELDSVGKKHGVKSPIELAKAWVKVKNEAKATKEALPKLGLPSPETATKDTQDVTIPTGLNINRDNIENQDRRPVIVRNDGQPFQTQAAAEQALKNKSTKKPRKNKAPITPETHEVIPVDGGFAIAPVVEIDDKKREAQIRSEINAAVSFYPDVLHKYAVENGLRESNDYSIMTSDMKKQIIDAVVKKELSKQNKKPDDNEDGGVVADASKPKPVSPSGGTIPSQHLDRISRGLKDGKTVEEIATRIQKSLPHLTIEDVTQQVLAEQAKASKPATLDSVIGKYSDDEEVDAEIRQSGEVLKQFLPETIDDWKIDKSTFATRGAWSVSYTKPYIVIDRKTGKEVVSTTTLSAPLDSEVLLSGDEQAIKDHINMRLAKNGITPKGIKDWRLDDAVSPKGQANPINVNSATIGTGSQDYADKLLAPAKKALADGNYSEHTTKTGKKIRLVIAEDNKSEAVIFAFDEKGNRPVATMTYSKYEENGTRFNPTIEVDKSLRRQGIATAMYKLAEQNGGLIPDLNQKGQARSDDGQKFRESMVAPETQIERKEAQTQQETIEGEYQHSKIESAKATVTKTDKGYDVDWGDEVQSFTGKNAQDKTLSALKSEDYSKQEGVVAPVINSKYQSFNDFIEKIKPQLANKKLDAAWVIAGKKIKNELPVILEQVKPYLDGIDYEQARGSDWKTPKVAGLPDLKIDASRRELSEDAFIFLIANELNKKGLLDFNAAPMVNDVVKQPKKESPTPTVEQKAKPKPAPTTAAGKQISEAMDKTATAITEAAHNKVVERIRKGEEIVYKKPDAIERAKQDDRYQVEINDKGHAVIKGIKDGDTWIGQSPDDGIKTKHVKQPKKANRVIDVEKDDLLAAIAKLDGLNLADAKSQGVDVEAYKGKRAAGLLGVFKQDGTGSNFDKMAEYLSGYGYPVHDGGNTAWDNVTGSYSVNALADALITALNGGDVGTINYMQNKMQAQMEADQKEAEEMERLFNGKGSSTWDEAEALDIVDNAIIESVVNGNTQIPNDILKESLSEATNEQDTGSGRQAPNAKGKETGRSTSNAEVVGNGKTGQQESQSSTGQDSGIGLNPSFNLNAQTNEELAKRDAENKAAEAKRQAEEKAAKDKAQADKEVSDFRLSGSNAPADVAMAGGQKDMFAAPTRGEREAEKAKQDGRITPDIAGNMKNGDIVRTKDGKEYLSLGARHDWLEVAPIINGKSQVNSESTFKFLLSPEKASAYPERRNEPIYQTGKNYYNDNQDKAQTERKEAQTVKKDNGPYYGDGYSAFNRGQPRTLPSYFTSSTGKNPKDWLKGWDTAKAEQAQDKSVQNNEPAPVKQPEAKTEPKAKIDFSEASVKLEDVLNKWEAIKKGDVVITKSGRALIAQADAKGKMSIRFKAREGGLEEALSILRVTGNNKVSQMMADILKKNTNDALTKKLIGKTPEGKDLYEDGRGVRFTDNGRGVQLGEDVAITMQDGKTIYDVSGRTDEHRTVEEVAARQPKRPQIGDEGYTSDMANEDLAELYLQQERNGMIEDDRLNQRIKNLEKVFYELRASEPNGRQSKEEAPTPKEPTKKESRLIEIDDDIDAAAKKLADVFKNMGKGTLNSGVDPVIIGKVLAIGVELSTLYLNKGAVKFSIWAENIINSLSKNGVPQDIVQPYLKRLYFASKADVSSEIRKQMDNDDDVIDFDFATLNVDKQTKGKENELPQLDNTSTKPLEGVSANDVQGIGSQRSTGGKTSGGSGTNLSGNERTGGAGLSTTRIMGDDTGEVSDTARGKGTERLAVTPAQDIATDFVITDEDNIGGGGLKTKYRNNVAAIRVLKQVESEGREATNEEQKILAKWVGWGSLYQAFRYSDGSIAKGWDKEVKELAELLTPEEMTAAVDSSVAAHYTSPKVVEAMWKAVQQLGFKNGKVLEPSVGSGNFFGAMPAKLRNSALLHGVELDNITGGIAKLLYPKAKIKAAMGFQDYAVPDGYFDLVIGNPPFGNIKITDKTKRHLDGFTLHNYFFAKSIDALREGGVLAMVVTNRLMDASNANDKARQYIDEHAELLGAVRLPNNAFLKNAGTQVTTDIIFLRKRVAGEDITTNKWMNVRQYQDKNGKTVPLNEYFHAHPEMMLGEFGAYGSMYTPDDPALVARDGQDTLALLNEAIAKLPKSVMPTVEQKSEEMAEKTAKDIPDVKVGSMFVEDGDIYIRQQDSLGERQADVVTLSGKAADRVKGMVNIRDAFILVRDAQLSPNKDSELPSLRKKLNVAYDNFVKTNGFINDDANKRLMRDDPSWPQLSALEEKYDKGLSAAVAKTTGEVARPVSASKAAIFNVRTQFPYATITSVSSAKDGYVESLNRYGKLDIDFVASLYGKSVADTIAELGNLIYQDPVRGWVTSSEYLSGNVKLKLQAAKLSLKAQEAAKGELEALPPIEQLHRGITALEAVIPEDIESVDIDIRAGAHWLPPKHIADFAREMLGINGNVGATYNKFDASWSVDFNQHNISAAKKTEWSTDRKTAAQILNAALNHKQATVYDKHDDGTTTVNAEATAEANEKVANLKRAWADWIWHDDNRRVELSRLYNDTFNTDAPTVFDGQHLTLAGKVDDDVLRLRPHQNDGIWRITQSDSTLLDHVVGAGKTFTMIGGAMELRRMGKSNKPMFVVPNHLVGQWAADFIKLYPSANILAATKADFEAKNRKKLFARIATGDWDAVIVAHSSFGKVSLHPDEEAKFIKKEIEEMMEAEALARKEGGEKARNAKDIGKRRLAKEDKLKKLLATKNKDDDNVYWNELGVDSLFVDEAHEFKNLAFTSTIQRVAGLGNQAGSQKATDLFTKIVSLKDRVAGAKVVFATGTPISNTMAEMYTMQRYLDLERMTHQGTVLFDAWARTFGEVVSDWELSPAGKYKMNSRFAKFVNMPELMQGYLSFADVINRDDINRQLAARGETLGTPKIRTGKPQNIVVERSQDQADYIGEASIDSNGNESYPEGSLVYRAENIPKKQEKGADNMLKIMSDARKAALDMRLIDPSLPDNPNSKVNEAIRRILTTYRQWNDDKGVQLVFCDLSTPKGAIAQEKARIEELVRLADEGDEAAIKELDEMSPDELDALNSSFSVYDDMKAKLIAQGIPANQVAFIHDAKTDIQKEALFGKVRSGQIRVLIGSTAKMGAGMNVQDRLVALHHLDAPWRPSDLEQREGRIIRQGNVFYKRDPEGFEVDIERYATKQTLDSRMWQTLEGKARFIEQIRKGDIKSRSVEDIGGEAANAAEMKAASSGNPLILEEMTLRREVQNLEAEKQRHIREQHRLKSTAKKLQEDNAYLEQQISKMEVDAQSKTPEEFEMTVGRKMFKQGEEKARERAGKALSDAAKDIYIKDESRVVGKFGDFDIVARLSYFGSTTFRVKTKSGLSYGEFSFDAEKDSMPGLTLKIANIANSIDGLLGSNKRTIENNNKEIPKVQALLSNWKDSAKLDEARKKHAEIINQLKPKEKVKVDDVKSDDQTKPIKPKFSRNQTIGDRTTTQVRDKLISRFGKRIVELLESKGILKIHQSMDTLPKAVIDDANGTEDGVYDDGKVHLIADNLTDETIIPTFVHELSGHKGFQEMMSPKAYELIMGAFNRLVAQGNSIALAAKERAEDAETDSKRQQDEYLPYLLTEQVQAQQATAKERNAVKRLIDHITRAVKGWLFRVLSKHNSTIGLGKRVADLLDEQDILLMAERMVGDIAKRSGDKEKGSQFSQLNTPQTQINAVRKKYEGTSQWMKAPNGQPTKLNEVQWLQVRTPNFKAWFGDWENDPENASKVIDENGEPLVVYHGTDADITGFDTGLLGSYTEAESAKKGFFFTNNPDLAKYYAIGGVGDKKVFFGLLTQKYPASKIDKMVFNGNIDPSSPGPNIVPVFLNIKNISSKDMKGRVYRETSYNDVIATAINDNKNGVVIKNTFDAGESAKDFPFGILEEKLYGALNKKSDIYVAFDPTQIKSAIGNTGEFNPTNPDIRFSRKAKNPITEGIKTAANDAKNSLPTPIAKHIDNFMAGRRLPSSDMANITAKTELSLYHRTISTQQNTALQLPDFKKVYDMAQRYLQHVSVDAYAALQAAPNLLGQLESWSDLKKEFRKAWPATYIKQKTDRAAVAAVIFDETLNNELLSEDDVLKALTRDQRKIYKEARDAIEVSLKNTAKSEMVRKLLAAEAINWTTVEDLMDKNLPVEQFAQSVRDLVESRIGGLSNELEAILDSDKMVKKAFKTGEKEGLSKAQKIELKKALAVKAQIDTTKEALKSLNDVEKRLDTLLEQGYAPLMRFGEYTLTVRGLDDKVKSFFMFETKAEQARAANAIVARYGKTVKLETDMISKEEFKQFAGMTPETMALFAKETGMDKDEAYQHYLKLAIPARSAMTRMIKRKGTEGFSDDIQRVVASFVMSNARMSAKNIYAAQIEKSIQAITSGKSVKDQALVMKENVFNPKENFAQLRNILFLWNLGGSLFFGLLNMTQPYLQTLPHLSQYVSIADAGRAILRGSKIAGVAMKNGHAPRGYEEEYNRAVREGHVDPQNVFMLSGVERGKTGLSNSWTSVASHLMGSIAQVTESFNRKAVFIASIDVANKKGAAWLKKHGFDSAYDFAVDSIAQTQGVYNKANRSNLANTSVGAPLMVFKQFSINYVEQMVRMWRKKAESGDEGKKAVFLMLAMLASLSGVMGLPFIKDILDVSETTAAYLGNPVNIEREARLALGKDLADPLFNGVLNHFVFNQLGVDVQSRTGMPDLVPWTNIANPTLKDKAFTRELMGITGATGGLINKAFDSAQLAAEGNVGAAAKTLAPRFLTSWIDGGKMALTNEVMDSKGNKIFDTTWDEGLVKFIDANPKRMADLSRTRGLEGKDKAIQAYMTTNFRQKIINAMMDDDTAEVNELMAKVKAWNEARPHYPVFINLNTLAKSANKKEQTFDARESIPKGMDWMKEQRPEM